MSWGYSGGSKVAPEPITDVLGVFNAIQRVAETQGLTLRQDEDCEQPRTDLESGEVTVEQLNAYWPAPRINKWRGEVYHEVGHHAPELKDIFPLMKKKNLDFQSLFGKVMNILEDVRNEFNNYGDWPGRDEALSWTQGFYCTQGVITLRLAEEMNADMKLFVNVMSWIYTYRGHRQLDVVAPALDFAELAEDKYSHLTPLLDSMTTAEDVYNLTRKILEESDDHDPDEEEQKAQKGSGEPSDEEGEGDEEGTEGDGKGEGEEGAAPVPEVSYEDLMGHSHSDPDDKKEGYTKINYDHTRRDYTPHTEMVVTKCRDIGGSGTNSSMKGYYNRGKSLAGIARRLFQSRTQSMKTHNHKSGRLDKRDLYRIPSGDVDVFTRKSAAPDPKGTALFILTDASGSMTGIKFNVTAAAVALLNDAVQPIGVPTEIAAFTENYDSCKHYIIKEFNEHRSSEKILKDYTNIEHRLSQNADGESIMWAFNRLMRRPEPRKILLVLSDGEPCADNEGDCWSYTTDVIKHVGKYVECYGVGIMDDSVQYLYPEFSVLNKASELEKCLLDVIKKKIFT